MDNRNSHWPIYDVVPIELIKIVSDTVKKAPVETVASKDGLVAYFLQVRRRKMRGIMELEINLPYHFKEYELQEKI